MLPVAKNLDMAKVQSVVAWCKQREVAAGASIGILGAMVVVTLGGGGGSVADACAN